MPKRKYPPLSDILPPLICGTGTFNTQYAVSVSDIPTNAIVARALELGVRAFDTSPYYGPSESLLGDGLAQDDVRRTFPRESYMLLTKCGRIGYSSFDYSPAWIRKSVARSLQRMRTTYLDVVYCHDVEFVSPAEVLAAVRELRRLRDEEGSVRYVGISAYPIKTLVSLSELILRETGEPIDVVQSYSNFNVQNTRLLSEGLDALAAAEVDVVTNASLLSMGLLRRNGVPESGQGDWHPAPKELRAAIARVSGILDARNEKLETVAIRYAVETWLRAAEIVGSRGDPALGQKLYSSEDPAASISLRTPGQRRLGVSVMGVTRIEELDETMRVWRSILLTSMADEDEHIRTIFVNPYGKLDGEYWDVESGMRRRVSIENQALEIKTLLGQWYDFVWSSPGEGFVNIVQEDTI